ncbi:D-arabinono-1,4-lactone oxidase [Cyclobacterium sp.]|uniref:D-arabinono-1,4-lactone oxidase n=1 Tax=Cyclobacterium sp. TaxID=1966343 RepID=UPI001984919E|nr:D-arabinono-1,4-lactone oxidase [Cyclobacterium sp.]MBD3629696.1 FAD-binding protein [Cyclobacterium sp.]
MKKRQFLKNSSFLVGANWVLPMISCDSPYKKQQGPVRTNWAGNVTYSTQTLEEPEQELEVLSAVKQQDKVKVLGTRHSFNGIADSQLRQVSLAKLDPNIQFSADGRTVSVNGAVQYGVLAKILQEQGFALHNLASLPHISVAGACATGTHGSGDQNGNLSTAVTAMEMIKANGEIRLFSEDSNPEEMKASVVHLGALGVVTRMRLRIQPTFTVRQFVYENLSLQQLNAQFDTVFSSGYSVSLFTDWQGEKVNQLWIKKKGQGIGQKDAMPESFLGASLAQDHLHPIKEISPVNCTAQMGLAGAWHERLPHFKMDFTPSSGEELQSEYFVPRSQSIAAINAIYSMGNEIYPFLLISEIRSIKKDELWLSPAYGRDSIAIHFTWKPDWENVRKLLPKIEAQLKPFQVRPHWGKLFTFDQNYLKEQYERMDDFVGLMKEMDPSGKFVNEFLQKNLLSKT